MADEFKTYDKAPIVGVVHINRWSFGLREIILAVIAIILLVMCLIFAGLFGHAENELASKPSAQALVGQSFCTSPACLKTASHTASYMNTSVDPCDNFYQYACGNYDVVKPIILNGPYRRSVLLDLRETNEDRLIDVMEKPIDAAHDHSSERKLKEFFQSCNDMYTREKLRGVPFLTKIIPELGGWKVLGTFDNSTWNFDNVLKRVQTEFWVDALYAIRDPRTTNGNIELRPGGLGKFMPVSWFVTNTSYAVKAQNDYKTFMRRVGTLLARDAYELMDPPLGNASAREMLVEEFVNDAFAVETMIANVSYFSRYTENPYAEESKITLAQLNADTNDLINWVDQISYLFSTAGVTANTKIILLKREYFSNMTRAIRSLPAEHRNRMLHNYFIWRVAEIYVQEFSWEYVHANREIFVDVYRYQNFLGIYRYCFRVCEWHFQDVLNALYVKDFFDAESRDTVHEITDNLKKALQTQIDKMTWFDDVTKTYAKEKLDAVSFQLGYPEWMGNMDLVDSIYTGFTVNVSDYFGNLINANQFQRDLWNQQLMTTNRREEWKLPVYSTSVTNYWWYNQIAATAGLLQFPIYDKNQPHYSTFGSLGVILANHLHQVVDEYGMHYDKQGNFVDDSWWTNKSWTDYQPISDCAYKRLDNITVNGTHPVFGDFSWKIGAQFYKTDFIAYTNGVRLAQIGYVDWMASSDKVVEKMLPGISLTDKQMIFLSQTQTLCHAVSSQDDYDFYHMTTFNNEILTNTAYAQLPEFVEAFSCKKGSKMNDEKKCDYY